MRGTRAGEHAAPMHRHTGLFAAMGDLMTEIAGRRGGVRYTGIRADAGGGADELRDERFHDGVGFKREKKVDDGFAEFHGALHQIVSGGYHSSFRFRLSDFSNDDFLRHRRGGGLMVGGEHPGVL